jgi:hypothetical protein
MSTYKNVDVKINTMTTKTGETAEEVQALENHVGDSETREFVKKVIEEETESVYILPREGAREVLTENRMELIEKLREDDVNSLRDLSRKLSRDVSAVSRDLEVLWKNDIIEYEEEQNRKIPKLTADKIVVEPL